MNDTLDFSTKKLFTSQTLVLRDDYAIFEEKRCCSSNKVELKLSDIRFFDKKGRSVSFGYRDRINMKGLKAEDINTIYNQVVSSGAKLGQGAEWTKRGTGICCDALEQFAILDDGLIYKYKKGGKHESSFVEWDKINVAVFPSAGVLRGDYIIIQGELDIVTTKTFPKPFVREIKEQLKTKGIVVDTGDRYRPSFLHGLKIRWNNSIILTEKGVLAKISGSILKDFLEENEMAGNKGQATQIIFIPNDKISSIGKSKMNKKNFLLVGKVQDLRSGTVKNVHISMPKPWLCAWSALKGKVKQRIRKQ